ncbi:hypothetical protein [Haloquadratum walsbyi]|jgi:hypothetical protein|uniref:C2H2-type domain-containing protein n=1 Tax=Haloquadratum walsbyi J07HQW2 TaxID=1238425 RepID=U1PMU9_9EURY|nr:hypothetical protein [Haloquadratum walsbyi]ERG95067.1 MAG: hypothetical protein J07HQW2_01512 [Haloquadratum walsbyi J07HQW2]
MSQDAPDSKYICDVCGRHFYTADNHILHRGIRHPAVMTKDEQNAYREAYSTEEAAIRSFRIRALGVLVVLYFGFLFLYVLYAS